MVVKVKFNSEAFDLKVENNIGDIALNVIHCKYHIRFKSNFKFKAKKNNMQNKFKLKSNLDLK